MPFQKGKSGNPEGRKKSKSARLTADLHQAVAADAMTIVKSIIASAKSGDVESRRAFLKLLPQGKWPTPFKRPKVAGPEDIPPAIDAVLDAAAKGDLSLDDAELVVGIINGLWQAYETTACARIRLSWKAATRCALVRSSRLVRSATSLAFEA
jgi:hypothetical protein